MDGIRPILGHMNFDISHVLEQWDYQPGQPAVRKFTGKDGVEKIQLRVDLGVLQMNADGRPDGKRPLGHPSLYEFYQAKLYKHLAANQGSDDGFRLASQDCVKLPARGVSISQPLQLPVAVEGIRRRGARHGAQPRGV